MGELVHVLEVWTRVEKPSGNSRDASEDFLWPSNIASKQISRVDS